jgi:peptide/nickel transport system permease protein
VNLSREAITRAPSIFGEAAKPSTPFSVRLRKWGQLARANPLGALGLVIILVFFACAVFAPVLATHDPRAVSADATAGISSEHLFAGASGPRHLRRVLYGPDLALVAFISVIGGGSVGILLGILSGYSGGPSTRRSAHGRPAIAFRRCCC